MYYQCFCQLMRRARPRLGFSSSLGLGLHAQSFVTRPSVKISYLLRRFTTSGKSDKFSNVNSFHGGLGLAYCIRRHFNLNSAAFMSPTFQRSEQMVNESDRREVEDDCRLDKVKQKILFNSVLERDKMNNSWLKTKIIQERYLRKEKHHKNDAKYKQRSKDKDFPIALKYMMDSSEYNVGIETGTFSDENEETPHETIVQLPYSVHNDLTLNSNHRIVSDDVDQLESRVASGQSETNVVVSETDDSDAWDATRRPKVNWMTDYELYADNGEEISPTECDADEPWELDYGTPDVGVPVSRVPCGGCGALLHCQDIAIPGYLPSELFKGRKDAELRSVTCQRCHFLRHYNTALSVSVAPDEYPRLLAEIRNKKALVILMVDLMDFPCSIWPNILDVIGTKRPVVVVGNKVDLLPRDSAGYLDHVKKVLIRTLEYVGLSAANIVHVALVSAMTGYGVDQLITKLHTAWEYKGDVYLVGCTNVGKSTLFNALLQSDYCKVKAADLLLRATTSPWPGTTLNLLKFPILRPAGWRLHERTQRLIAERKGVEEERQLRQHQVRKTRTAATLLGHIGRTFRPTEQEIKDPFAVSTRANSAHSGKLLGLDPNDKEYMESKWCYDTPGTVQPDQVINLLTTEELMLTLPKRLLHPRTFSLSPGRTLFVAGLGRLDYLSGDVAIRFTVFASDALPITVCQTHDADEVHSALIGSALMAVPSNGEERLARWPGLAADKETIRVKGEDWRTSCADVVLSSAGWVAITPGREMEVELRAWTPGGRGVFVRPPLLRYSVNHRGARIPRSPAYKMGIGLLV